MFEKSAKAIANLIPAYVSGKVNLEKQDESKASYTYKLKKSDAYIPGQFLQQPSVNIYKSIATLVESESRTVWKIPFIKDYFLPISPLSTERFIRAMQPWPRAWTRIVISRNGKQIPLNLTILKAHVEDRQNKDLNATVTQLVLDEVQLEGKKPVSWKVFKSGYPSAVFVKV
jgi:methionyl-tRNA formyltransferase